MRCSYKSVTSTSGYTWPEPTTSSLTLLPASGAPSRMGGDTMCLMQRFTLCKNRLGLLVVPRAPAARAGPGACTVSRFSITLHDLVPRYFFVSVSSSPIAGKARGRRRRRFVLLQEKVKPCYGLAHRLRDFRPGRLTHSGRRHASRAGSRTRPTARSARTATMDRLPDMIVGATTGERRSAHQQQHDPRPSALLHHRPEHVSETDYRRRPATRPPRTRRATVPGYPRPGRRSPPSASQ